MTQKYCMHCGRASLELYRNGRYCAKCSKKFADIDIAAIKQLDISPADYKRAEAEFFEADFHETKRPCKTCGAPTTNYYYCTDHRPDRFYESIDPFIDLEAYEGGIRVEDINSVQ